MIDILCICLDAALCKPEYAVHDNSPHIISQDAQCLNTQRMLAAQPALADTCAPAGIVPIVHNSGGPMMDIVVPSSGESAEGVGFRCESDEEYAQAISYVLSMEQSRRLQIAAAARR